MIVDHDIASSVAYEDSQDREYWHKRCCMHAEQLSGYERQLGIEPGSTQHTIGSEIERLMRYSRRLESDLGNAQRQILNLRNALTKAGSRT